MVCTVLGTWPCTCCRNCAAAATWLRMHPAPALGRQPACVSDYMTMSCWQGDPNHCTQNQGPRTLHTTRPSGQVDT